MKKELYIAPELELLSLTSAERLANDEITIGNNAVSVEPEIDIDVPL